MASRFLLFLVFFCLAFCPFLCLLSSSSSSSSSSSASSSSCLFHFKGSCFERPGGFDHQLAEQVSAKLSNPTINLGSAVQSGKHNVSTLNRFGRFSNLPCFTHGPHVSKASDCGLYRHPNTAHCFYNKGTAG